jgi:hypothetical protein
MSRTDIEDLARQRWGEPNPALSSRKELRFGRKGSVSLSIAGENAGVWHCFETGQGGRFRDDDTVRPVAPVDRPKKRWSREAEGLWKNARPITPATSVGEYLKSRGCVLPPIDGDLRMAGGTMVGRVTDALTGEPMTIHKTLVLQRPGQADIKQRKYLAGHQKKGGIIRIWPDADVTLGLGLGEGIETCLAAAKFFRPVWAAGDALGMAEFPVLAGIECLTIFEDHDPAGQKAARKVAARWACAGVETRLWRAPEIFTDFADTVS